MRCGRMQRMTARPYVLLSVAASVDGYIDDAGDGPLVLSNAEDLDRVDAVRASVDAILVGANTIRRDDPRLLVKSGKRRAERVSRGLSPNPIKVTVTGGGHLDPGSKFFTAGEARKIVYTSPTSFPAVAAGLADAAEVVAAGDPVDLRMVLADLHERDVRRVMVEGGTTMHTQFLTQGLADELQLAIAPFFVGDPAAPRFVGPGTFPVNPKHPMTLAGIRQIGNIVLIRYVNLAANT